MILEVLWLFFLAVAIVPIGAYILFMRKTAKDKPWNVKVDPDYEPTLSIIIPTYEEASTIVRKLDNVAEVNYPKEKLDITIVDSASRDETVHLVSEWAEKHPRIRTQIACENERRGMVPALNYGLKHVSGEVVVKTDADCLWNKDSLRNAVKYLADPKVASVAGLQSLRVSRETWAVKTERTYRGLYNWLRIGESKLHSSVLYEGELMLLKRDVIEKIGFDEDIGADDLPTAIRLTENKFRAIVADDAHYVEQTPYSWGEKIRQKIRRGRHVIQALWKYKYLIFKENTVFHKLILPFETYIYIVSPLLAVPFLTLSIAMLWKHPWILIFAFLFIIGSIRELFVTYLVDVSIILLSILNEIRGREKVTWEKIGEIREP